MATRFMPNLIWMLPGLDPGCKFCFGPHVPHADEACPMQQNVFMWARWDSNSQGERSVRVGRAGGSKNAKKRVGDLSCEKMLWRTQSPPPKCCKHALGCCKLSSECKTSFNIVFDYFENDFNNDFNYDFNHDFNNQINDHFNNDFTNDFDNECDKDSNEDFNNAFNNDFNNEFHNDCISNFNNDVINDFS